MTCAAAHILLIVLLLTDTFPGGLCVKSDKVTSKVKQVSRSHLTDAGHRSRGRISSDDSRIIFPSATERSVTTPVTLLRSSTTSPAFQRINKTIPVSLFMEFSNVTNPVNFLNKYAINGEGQQERLRPNTVRNNTNFSWDKTAHMRERTLNAPLAHAAGCKPQPTTVPIEMTGEPYVMYFPSCTRVDRCDGCCNTELLECAPTKREKIRLQILKLKYLGPDVSKFDVSEPVVIELDRHLQCDCQCRVKAADCQFYQVYRPNECRCECVNQDEAATCTKFDKIWDFNACHCRCREHHDCSTGYFFNFDTCNCEIKRSSRIGGGPAFRDI